MNPIETIAAFEVPIANDKRVLCTFQVVEIKGDEKRELPSNAEINQAVQRLLLDHLSQSEPQPIP